MGTLPLQVFIGPQNEIIAYNNEIVAGLTEFELDTDPHIQTTYKCANVFPRQSGHRVMPGQNDNYPLRIYAGDNVDELLVGVQDKLFGVVIRHLHIKLSATEKRLVRLTTHLPLPDVSKLILLDLGVELIVEPPEGDMNAHL